MVTDFWTKSPPLISIATEILDSKVGRFVVIKFKKVLFYNNNNIEIAQTFN